MRQGDEVLTSKDGEVWDGEAIFVCRFENTNVVKTAGMFFSSNFIKRADLGPKGKVYNTAVNIDGDLCATYCFESESDSSYWIREELPKLRKKYGNLSCRRYALDALEVGDTCRVSWEGYDECVILEVKEQSPNRPVFILDSGWLESVHKCYKIGDTV